VQLFNLRVRLNWLAIFRFRLILPLQFWLGGNQLSISLKSFKLGLKNELEAIFGQFILPGTVLVFTRLFMFILMSNFLGLFPHIFTGTRHLSLTLSLSLPLWLGRMAYNLWFQLNFFFAHLVPEGTPRVLIPVIVVIETVRNIIRPGTLAVRLAANIIAGHLLLTLLGSQMENNIFSIKIVFLFRALLMLVRLEIAVSCIQSYVFVILSSLYLNEVMRVDLNKQLR